MIRFLKHTFFLLFIFNLITVNAQNNQKATTHKVVAGETVYGISHKYGLTEDDLRNANPRLIDSNFGLKAGDVIVIPSKGAGKTVKNVNTGNVINVGIMLPLNSSSEGLKMVEYYRGILLACDDLRKQHVNINIHAWDVDRKTDIDAILNDGAAKKCNIIFGPYYSDQVAKAAGFAKAHDIRLAVPFAPAGSDIRNNSSIYTLNVFNPYFYDNTCIKFFNLFEKTNPIIINCNDPVNGKGDFTKAARTYFENEDIKYSITNITSDDKDFVKAFKKNRKNIVILNSSGLNELKSAAKRLKTVRAKYPDIQISVLGYNEWFGFEKYESGLFSANDVYIPTYFYYNSHSSDTKKIEADYFRWFKKKMNQTLPRLAICGYDHAMFFLRGMNVYGSSFNGSEKQKAGHIQMPMHFEKVSPSGGYRNAAFMFIHYKKDLSIESLAY